MISRRGFLTAIVGSGAVIRSGVSTLKRESIDRAALVRRHNPVLRQLDPLSPLSLGNGEFAFTADITGLQTLPQSYENAMPLCTMSQWGWHTKPPPADLNGKGLRLTEYDTYGRVVGYQTSSEGQADLYNWLRENPHRLHLGEIGLRRTNGEDIRTTDLSDVHQELDLWTGRLTSTFRLNGKPVTVTSAVHPDRDLLAVRIDSVLVAEGKVQVRLAFPYGSPTMQAADWQQLIRHKTTLVSSSAGLARLHRRVDSDQYFVAVKWNNSQKLLDLDAHSFLLSPPSDTGSRLEFVVEFTAQQSNAQLPGVSTTFAASADHWRRFWTEGGTIELSRSSDQRAPELERRVVLSQYLTAIQCSGSMPPQETGLTVNSWYGKFHLEMHWWHAAHFALWNRLPLLEKSLGWYNKILPVARQLAKLQGYVGARWPKMVGPEGRDSPSPIGPLLIWQQPHPITYAELCYQARPTRQTLERYREIVFESADFMASFAFYDEKTQRYVLGPPLIPAQENHPPRETWNPTFELAYWRYGLKNAQLWREHLGLSRNPVWDRVIARLSPLPVRDGIYLAHENCPQTFTERNRDHPSMLGALGMLPGETVDRETMRRTLFKVMKEWKWDQTWGWDYPLTAMTAARLGEGKLAIDALLMTTEKNRYLRNGHNWQRPNLPCYLPGNGGLLYAVAMMAGGWRGSPRRHAPGFPDDGSWTVRSEGLNAALMAQL